MINFPAPVSPQAKIIQTADKFGNKAVQYQQGTTRIIFDSLPVDGRTEYRFFENANARSFPFTNVEEGKLNALETLTIMRMYLAFLDVDSGDPNDIQAISNLNAADPNFQAGILSISTAESTIAKNLPVSSFLPEFNKNAYWDEYSNFGMDTLLTLQPDLIYQFSLRIPTGVTIADQFVRLVVEGVGTIISPKAVF